MDRQTIFKMKRINLVIEYYISGNSERQEELDHCLQHNLNNAHIDQVYLFYDKNECNHQHEKITSVKVSGRLHYSDFFRFIKNGEFNSQEIFILANSDIHFDDSLGTLKGHDLSGKAICLTRYENDILHKHPHESQDTWIINAGNIPDGLILDSMFTLGVPGCDNRIAYLLNKHRFTPCNPCKDIKSYHKHASSFRTYGVTDKVDGPYLLVPASKL